jgi:hypothetical protein
MCGKHQMGGTARSASLLILLSLGSGAKEKLFATWIYPDTHE